MVYDYPMLFKRIVAAVEATGNFVERMRTVIAECERQRPHADWGLMQNIDFDADTASLPRWLSNSLAEAPTDASYRGLWFGLCNPSIAGKATADIYVSPTLEFESRSMDWATKVGSVSETYFLNSVVLAAIHNLAYGRKGGLGNAAEYPLALAYGAMAARFVLESDVLPPALTSLLGTAVGFDSGDFLFLGDFQSGKFVTRIKAG